MHAHGPLFLFMTVGGFIIGILTAYMIYSDCKSLGFEGLRIAVSQFFGYKKGLNLSLPWLEMILTNSILSWKSCNSWGFLRVAAFFHYEKIYLLSYLLIPLVSTQNVANKKSGISFVPPALLY